MNRGDLYVHFIEQLRVPAGKYGDQLFKLQPWQREFIQQLFGTLTEDGTRIYRESMLFLPKKNGKTTLCAAIVLAALMLEPEIGAEIYSAANSRDQAGVVYRHAAKMVRSDPYLKKKCTCLDSKKRIERRDNGSFYQALSAEARDKNGGKCNILIFDEIAEWTGATREIYDKLISGTAGTAEPLTISLTTAGITKGSVGYDIYKRAKRALAKPSDDPTFLPVIYESADDDWQNIANWKKCNPNWGITLEPSYATEAIKKAKDLPSEVTTILRYNLNRWVDAALTWIPSQNWDACGLDHFDPEDLKGKRCYLGVDLASTIDLAAVVALFPLDNGKYAVLPRFYCPEETMAVRERRDRVPYLTWERNKQLIATSGNVIDYERIRADINELGKTYRIQSIGIDRWNSTQLSTQLSEHDRFKVVPYGQGTRSMTSPCKELERLVMSKNLQHNNHPALAWMARNVVVEQDAAGNMKPNREKSTEKIDGIVALLMALGMALEQGDAGEKSVYEGRGILIM